jgi:GTP-binding protein YchF
MALQAGIVGLPNVGKSTLFNALTAAGAEAANYPFCTIEPNVGILTVPDARMDRIKVYIKPQKIIPAVVELVDIAGLVRGASRGEGLGNQFLGHIRSVDAVLQVVRCFEDSDVTHVEGSIDPIRDIDTIETELILADLDSCERRQQKYARQAKGGDKDSAFHAAVAQRMYEALNQGIAVRALEFTAEEAASVAMAQMITSKPVLYVCNVDEAGLSSESSHVKAVRERAAQVGAGVVLISARIESEIAELDDADKKEFLESLGLPEPGLAVLARETYRLLGLQTYFTAGEKEIRAWTIGKGWTAPQAAGVIHTDFEKGFIKAEVYSIEDLETYKSEAAMKAAGRLRLEGKEYVVRDGDVMHFRFNV